MPIHSSGIAISMSEINAEFALGTAMSTYRGVTWYTDAGGTGTFPAIGAISMDAFYDKRLTKPNVAIDYLIVAGGGAGGSWNGAGGGAGGFLSGAMSVAIGGYGIVVGAGGVYQAQSTRTYGNNGQNSSFNSVTALGGGGGAGYTQDSSVAAWNGSNGGSGGGSCTLGNVSASGGTPAADQGFRGGNVTTNSGGSGGGGAGGAGGDNTAELNNTYTARYAGGPGKIWLDGIYYAGGGGGYRCAAWNGSLTGGGGTSSNKDAGRQAGSGVANSGGGGGGGDQYTDTIAQAGSGGSGIVVIRYPGATKATGGTISSIGGYTYHYFYSSGTFTLT